MTPGSPLGQLRENVTLTTAEPDYSRVNLIQVWRRGPSTSKRARSARKAYTA